MPEPSSPIQRPRRALPRPPWCRHGQCQRPPASGARQRQTPGRCPRSRPTWPPSASRLPRRPIATSLRSRWPAAAAPVVAAGTPDESPSHPSPPTSRTRRPPRPSRGTRRTSRRRPRRTSARRPGARDRSSRPQSRQRPAAETAVTASGPSVAMPPRRAGRRMRGRRARRSGSRCDSAPTPRSSVRGRRRRASRRSPTTTRGHGRDRPSTAARATCGGSSAIPRKAADATRRPGRGVRVPADDHHPDRLRGLRGRRAGARFPLPAHEPAVVDACRNRSLSRTMARGRHRKSRPPLQIRPGRTPHA